MDISKYNSKYEEPKSLMFQMLDIDGKILHVNDKWLEEMGYEREEVIGKFFGSFIEKSDHKAVKENFPHLKDYGFVNNVQFKLKRKDGVLIETVLNGISVYDEEGSFVNTRCELRNLSYFMEAETYVKNILEKERFFKNNLYLKSELNRAVVYCKDLDQFLKQVINIFKEPIEIIKVYISLRDNYGNRKVYIDEQLEYEHSSRVMKFLNNDKYMSSKITDSLVLDNKSENDLFDNFKDEFYFGESLVVFSTASHKKYECDKIDVFIHLKDISNFADEWTFFAEDLKNIIQMAIDKFETQQKLQSVMKELYKMSTTDSLTGVYNKYKFEKIFLEEIERFNRDKRAFSLVRYDVDDLKKINDSLGHFTGDKILKELSKLVENSISENEQLFRFGADEFILIFSKSDIRETVKSCEKIKSAIERYNFYNSNLTCSFGITEMQEGDTLESLLGRADKALTRSKENGKNAISVNRM